jgi:hypothetical protein
VFGLCHSPDGELLFSSQTSVVGSKVSHVGSLVTILPVLHIDLTLVGDVLEHITKVLSLPPFPQPESIFPLFFVLLIICL